MSEDNLSDSIHSQLAFPLLLFAVGAILLWTGYTQFLEFKQNQADYLMLRPDNQTIVLLILGGASIIAGFLGSIRGYLYR